MGMKPRKKPEIKIDRERYLELVDKIGRARQRALGEEFSDVDFAMGASVIFTYLEEMGPIPGRWVFGALRGDKLFPAD